MANVAVFIIAKLSGPISFDYLFGLMVPEVFTSFRIYQFVTYLFVHGDLFHLLFNMLILYIFGRELEIYWGRPFFLRYYFISGIGAGICSIPFVWGIQAPLIGASGSLFALLIAYGMLFPNRVITLLLFFVLPLRMRARQMVLIFIGLEIIFLLGKRGGGGIAHFAHLGGALVGYIYLKWPDLSRKCKGLLRSLSYNTRGAKTKPKTSDFTGSNIKTNEEDLQAELNRILDKLAQKGWQGLSREEKEFLHNAGNKL